MSWEQARLNRKEEGLLSPCWEYDPSNLQDGVALAEVENTEQGERVWDKRVNLVLLMEYSGGQGTSRWTHRSGAPGRGLAWGERELGAFSIEMGAEARGWEGMTVGGGDVSEKSGLDRALGIPDV